MPELISNTKTVNIGIVVTHAMLNNSWNSRRQKEVEFIKVSFTGFYNPIYIVIYIYNRFHGVMVSMFISHAVDNGSRIPAGSSQTL